MERACRRTSRSCAARSSPGAGRASPLVCSALSRPATCWSSPRATSTRRCSRSCAGRVALLLRHAPRSGADRFHAALALWRGPPLAQVRHRRFSRPPKPIAWRSCARSPWRIALAPDLALVDQGADHRRGRSALVVEQPLRERPRTQLCSRSIARRREGERARRLPALPSRCWSTSWASSRSGSLRAAARGDPRPGSFARGSDPTSAASADEAPGRGRARPGQAASGCAGGGRRGAGGCCGERRGVPDRARRLRPAAPDRSGRLQLACRCRHERSSRRGRAAARGRPRGGHRRARMGRRRRLAHRVGDRRRDASARPDRSDRGVPERHRGRRRRRVGGRRLARSCGPDPAELWRDPGDVALRGVGRGAGRPVRLRPDGDRRRRGRRVDRRTDPSG